MSDKLTNYEIKVQLLEDYENETRSTFWKTNAIKIVAWVAIALGLGVWSFMSFKAKNTALGFIVMTMALLVHSAVVASVGIQWGSMIELIKYFKISTLIGSDDDDD